MGTRIGILLTLSSLLGAVYAQQYEFGISAAGTGYMGDLNPSNPFYFKNVGAGISAKYNLNSSLGFQLAYHYLQLSGADHDQKSVFQQTRNLSFNNTLSEVALTGEFNFFRYIPGQQINVYTPYITAGIAGILHDPYVIYHQKKVMLRELRLEADDQGQSIVSKKFAIAVPIGLGFKYNIQGPWTLAADLSYRTVWNDYIDNVSQYYNQPATNDQYLPKVELIDNGNTRLLDQSDWNYLADPSGQLVQNAGTARGNGKKLDGYMTAGIKLSYTILSKKCYWWQ